MPRIPAAELDRIKAEVAVQRLVEAFGIKLKHAGKDWLGRCPFHADDTASLVVSPNKNLWHCFGCGAAGGPIDWVIKTQGVSFRHAVELLREGPSLPGAVEGKTPAPVRQSTTPKLAAPVALDADDQTLLDQVIDYYHTTLQQSPEALAYLEARGIADSEAIRHFKLGYANRTLGLRLPEKNRVVGNTLRTQLQKVGIYRDSGHEHLNGSLVIPILDANGHVLGAYGRKVLDTLRAGTPKHLYLAGPHRGVWNLDGVVSSAEVIVCEALIDALSFWCADLKNVTTAYGIEGITDELIGLLLSEVNGQKRRVLIAFDRDDAGERGADKLAKRLMAEGVACYRVQFPKGMDANAYALKVQPAAKSLALLVRKAVWLGEGPAPNAKEAVAEQAPVEPAAASSIAPPVAPAPTIPLAAENKAAPAEPSAMAEQLVTALPPTTVLAPAPELALDAEVSAEEVVMRFGEGPALRRWRVRGLPKNLAVGVLKVNLMVANSTTFHVDTLDLYAARVRAVFVQQAAAELRVSEATLKIELGRVLLKLEQLQDETIQSTLEPKALPVIDMTEDEREAAMGLLHDPDLLGRVLADFEASGIVGEATNKLTAYLAATSRKLERPLAVVIQSSSAAGKSSLMDAVLAMMPPEETVRYSAMSGQSLFYMGENNLKHKVLAIAEEEGASRASYALKLLQSDGALTMASTGTDANGNLVAQEYRVEGPMSLFMTTTAIDVDEELLNRCLVLSVDEGREQTAAIHQRQRERRTLNGLMGRQAKDALLILHRNAQRLLRPIAVVNPYADQLTFLDDRTRTRRDHEKYLSLIDTVTFLHQAQRPIKSVTVAGRSLDYIEVTLADIARANALAHEVLGRSLDELPAQTRKLLVLVRDLVNARMASTQLPRSEVRLSRKDVRDATGWGDTQIKVHLARLVEMEYLLAHRVGQALVYELLYDGDGNNEPYLSGLIDPVSLGYDGERSGLEAQQSVPGRGVVGPQSGPGRQADPGAAPVLVRLDVNANEDVLETRHPRQANGASYPHHGVAVRTA